MTEAECAQPPHRRGFRRSRQLHHGFAQLPARHHRRRRAQRRRRVQTGGTRRNIGQLRRMRARESQCSNLFVTVCTSPPRAHRRRTTDSHGACLHDPRPIRRHRRGHGHRRQHRASRLRQARERLLADKQNPRLGRPLVLTTPATDPGPKAASRSTSPPAKPPATGSSAVDVAHDGNFDKGTKTITYTPSLGRQRLRRLSQVDDQQKPL